MKNLQAPWARAISDGATLEVHSIFDTIQGEGPFAGEPAVFLRLAGCNLQCPLCDTEYTDGSYRADVNDIVTSVCAKAAGDIMLVVITGGEPFRQNIAPLIHLLISYGFQVQIETNGMLPVQDSGVIWEHVDCGNCHIVISPKTSSLDSEIIHHAAAFKYVVKYGDLDPGDLISRAALDHPLPKNRSVGRPPADWQGVVYIQPADEQDPALNAINMEAAVRSVRYKAPGEMFIRRLSIQMHKIAELP